jgi:hypothetical protein
VFISAPCWRALELGVGQLAVGNENDRLLLRARLQGGSEAVEESASRPLKVTNADDTAGRKLLVFNSDLIEAMRMERLVLRGS